MVRKPQSMDELLDMSADEFRQIDEWLYRGNLSAKRITKDMIRILNRELEWKGHSDSMSLRGLWYSGPKQVYQNAFPEKWSDPDFNAVRRYAQYLSEYLSEMVKDGEVTYRGLNIVDDSRQREVAQDTIEDDKILFVEKEAAYRNLLPIQEVFEISLVSGGGWEATALIEDLAHHLDPDQSYQLFVLSDYDPTGYRIAEDFEARAQKLGVNITQVERIGIEPDQVSDRVRRQERFDVPVGNDYDEEWLWRYGIEDRYGLEIEAIGDLQEGGRPLREIVVEAMRPHLRWRRRRSRDLNISTSNAVGVAANQVRDKYINRFEDAIREWAADRMAEQDEVNRCYTDDTGKVFSNVNMDAMEGSMNDNVPSPLEVDDYVENAVDAPDDGEGGTQVVTPSRGVATYKLQRKIEEAIEDGEIDAKELLGL